MIFKMKKWVRSYLANCIFAFALDNTVQTFLRLFPIPSANYHFRNAPHSRIVSNRYVRFIWDRSGLPRGSRPLLIPRNRDFENHVLSPTNIKHMPLTIRTDLLILHLCCQNLGHNNFEQFFCCFYTLAVSISFLSVLYTPV